MHWSATTGMVALLLAYAPLAQAQANRPIHPSPYAPQGCQGPGSKITLPPVTSPLPGSVMPGPVSPIPGNVMPSRPGNVQPPVSPTTPTTPSNTPTSPTTPTAPTPTPSPSMDTPAQASAAPSAGSGANASAAPNMFGDTFGPNAITIVIPQTPIQTPTIPGATNRLGGFFVNTNTAQRFVFTGTAPTNPQFPAQGATAFGQPITTNFVSTGGLITNGFGEQAFALLPNAQDQAATLAQAQRLFGPGGNLVYVADPNASRAVVIGFVAQTPGQNPGTVPQAQIATFYDYIQPGTPGSFIPRDPIVLVIANPSAGGIVGRTKIADDNNPLPRDRFIFNYDYFDNARLSANGVNVHRFSPGIEKTFLNQSASIEVRLPFACTLNSDVSSDSLSGFGGISSNNVELGDLHLNFKALLYSSDTINVASGVGLSVPTADDLRVRLGSREVLRIHNDAFILEPYVAALYTPNDRLFMQAWAQFNFNLNSNRVDGDPTLSGNLAPIGGLYDHSSVFTSLQLGYYVYSSDCADATLSGLAPFVELHYNATLGGANSVQVGSFTVGDRRSLDELNMTIGVAAVIRQNFLLMIGGSAPLIQGDDRHRTFDYQIGIRGNVFFGATAAERNNRTRISSF